MEIYQKLLKIKLSKSNPDRNPDPKSDHDITSVVLLGSATYTASLGNETPKATLMSFELYATLWLLTPMKIYCIDLSIAVDVAAFSVMSRAGV